MKKIKDCLSRESQKYIKEKKERIIFTLKQYENSF